MPVAHGRALVSLIVLVCGVSSSGMLGRLDFDVRTAGAAVLPVEQPVWIQSRHTLSRACYWEQRYWHAELNEHAREQRSKEFKRGLRQRISFMYSLDEKADWIRPGDGADAPQTVILNTRALLAWQLHKFNVYKTMGNDGKNKAIAMAGFLRRVCSQAARASDKLDVGQLPSIDATGGVQVPMLPHGRIHIAGLATACGAQLEEHWNFVRETSAELGLASYDVDDTLLSDFFLFVDRICRMTGTEEGKWFWNLRVALLNGVAFLAEFAVMDQLADDEKDARLRVPHVLLGPKKLRRQKHMILSKIDLQRKIEQDGSAATSAAALGLSRGMASTVQGIQNEHYSTLARAHMAGTTSYCVNWDQSTHGGYDMNVGFVLDSNSKKGCYIRPAASRRPSVGSTFGGRGVGATS